MEQPQILRLRLAQKTRQTPLRMTAFVDRNCELTSDITYAGINKARPFARKKAKGWGTEQVQKQAVGEPAVKILSVNDPHDILPEDPLELFDAWLMEAQESEPNDPNAAALGTSTRDGAPSVRMVLAKRIGAHRFCFFTNSESRKGIELAENPRAALCFHWKTLRRQVRVEGGVSELDATDVDEYFHSRSRASQIGAAVSEQSRILSSREDLEERVRIFGEEHPGEVPRPSSWRGFYLRAERIEFWLDGANRLHDRFLFEKKGQRWQRTRLYP